MTAATPILPEPLAGFVRHWIRSIWTLETLLLLLRERERAWSPAQLTAELRSSTAAVAKAVSQLQAAGLLRAEDAGVRYHPDDDELDGLVRLLADAYARTPVAVVKAILAAPDDKLRSFADAFRLKRD